MSVDILSIRLGALEKAFVEYYAHVHDRSQAEIIRTMINKYVNGDRAFDPAAFKRFVSRHMLDRIEDPDDRDKVKSAVRVYAATREAADAPTLTQTKRK